MPINFNLQTIREKYNLNTFFETGFYKGASIQKALDAGFEKAISIEVSKTWYEFGLDKFKKEIEDGVFEIILDDSSNIEKYLDKSIGNIFYWLDAHADQPATHERGKHACPLYCELDAIKTVLKDSDLIAIDDMRIIKNSSTWGNKTSFDKIVEKLKDFGRTEYIYLDGHIKNDVFVSIPTSY